MMFRYRFSHFADDISRRRFRAMPCRAADLRLRFIRYAYIAVISLDATLRYYAFRDDAYASFA